MKIEELDKNMTSYTDTNNITWYNPNIKPFTLKGFAFFSQDNIYRRLPLCTEKLLESVTPNVNALSWNTAGGQIHFRTNSKSISLKVVLDSPELMCHMAATGQSGFDCYIKEDNKEYIFVGCTKYEVGKSEYEVCMCDNLLSQSKDILINFPLYRGVKKVLVGLVEGSELSESKCFSNDGCVVTYGTSITQGGCASRPGMAYTNILSRWLDMEFINLGFSGNGLGEPEIAEIITSIENTKMFILDYEANAGANGLLEKTLPGFIKILRDKHPSIPIVVISLLRLSGLINPVIKTEVDKLRIMQSELVQSFINQGDKNIYFLNGYDMFGEHWHENTVDGVHPTDLGFFEMAKALKEPLSKILFPK